MKNQRFYILLISIFLAQLFESCTSSKDQIDTNPLLFDKNNLVAWCIVPFDSKKRNPEERAKMLSDLGIKSLAWDWREEHVSTLEEEINALKKYDIELKSVWFWVDGNNGMILNNSTKRILETLEKTGTQTELWVSFPASFFENMTDDEKVQKGINTIKYLQSRVSKIGCKIALYNHGDWFGEPVNQIMIIEGLEDKDVGLVYNFHHAHDQLDGYEELIQIMKPYLWTVNLNGMKKNGPKIIDIGKGDEEMHMMQTLKSLDFHGSIGILGHTEGEDIEVVLKRNLEGLKYVLEKMEQHEALSTY